MKGKVRSDFKKKNGGGATSPLKARWLFSLTAFQEDAMKIWGTKPMGTEVSSRVSVLLMAAFQRFGKSNQKSTDQVASTIVQLTSKFCFLIYIFLKEWTVKQRGVGKGVGFFWGGWAYILSNSLAQSISSFKNRHSAALCPRLTCS